MSTSTLRHLFLHGFMGTGKSTLGPIVADRLNLVPGRNMPFIDLDREVEQRAGHSIPAIFQDEGENEFRRLERDTFRKIATGPAAVIALGGATLNDPASRDLAETTGVICSLTCSAEVLETRLREHTDRPVLANRTTDLTAHIATLLAHRRDTYSVYPEIRTDTNLDSDALAAHLCAVFEERPTFEVRLSAEQRTPIAFVEAAHPICGPHMDPPASGRFVLTDTALTQRHGPTVESLLASDPAAVLLTIQRGEASKTLETAAVLYQELLHAGADRQSVLLVLGGGVLSDLGAYVASTYMRGIRLVLIPTTLLAQIDAAIGGKTGVDVGGTKNLVGSFFPATAIVVAPQFLQTLETGLLRQGLAEMIKIGFVRDPQLVDALASIETVEALLQQPEVIRSAIRNKVAVVNADPRERTGERALLNFGHTIGHAIETLSGFTVPHGECVSIGMAAEARFALSAGLATNANVERLESMLRTFGLPTDLPDTRLDELLHVMHHDKKASGGTIRMVLLNGVGSAELLDVGDSDLKSFLSEQPGVAS
jgi:shikimate kinase/3-dehydroquinate synthase